MTTTAWITDSILLLIVLRQLREEKLSAHLVLLPLGLVGYFAAANMTAIPTVGNDLLLISLCTAVGVTLGVLGGLFTHIRVKDGTARVRAGFVSAALWIAGMGTRMAFVVYVSHTAGRHAVGTFSAAHHITPNAWADALLLMVCCEVVIRVATIVVRGRLAVAADRKATARPAQALPELRLAA
jgi:hypothetical protein